MRDITETHRFGGASMRRLRQVLFGYARGSGWRNMTDDELIVEFALTRLDNPDLDLEEIAALVVRRMGAESMLEFASRNLATRGELRGAVFPSAVEHVLRVVLTLRGPAE
jgi:hypothetical protein